MRVLNSRPFWVFILLLSLVLIIWKVKRKQKLLAAFLIVVKWFGMCSAHHKFAQDLPVIITDEQREPVIVSLQMNCHGELRYERLRLAFSESHNNIVPF